MPTLIVHIYFKSLVRRTFLKFFVEKYFFKTTSNTCNAYDVSFYWADPFLGFFVLSFFIVKVIKFIVDN